MINVLLHNANSVLSQDATWVAMGNTLKCTCPSDVILLLKSSDFVMHDLSRV